MQQQIGVITGIILVSLIGFLTPVKAAGSKQIAEVAVRPQPMINTIVY